MSQSTPHPTPTVGYRTSQQQLHTPIHPSPMAHLCVAGLGQLLLVRLPARHVDGDGVEQDANVRYCVRRKPGLEECLDGPCARKLEGGEGKGRGQADRSGRGGLRKQRGRGEENGTLTQQRCHHACARGYDRSGQGYGECHEVSCMASFMTS